MPLDPTPATAVALAVAGCALVLAGLLAVRLGRLQRACDALVSGGAEGGAASFAQAVRRSQSTGEALQREVDTLRRELGQVRADAATGLRHLAVVRYDAFDDLAGRLSFSAALLDDAGDGLVLSSINGRSETRTYAKGVTAGGSGHPLSPEEKEAIARARSARPAQVPAAADAPRARLASRLQAAPRPHGASG